MQATLEKLDKQQLSDLYDKLYDELDAFLKKHNPCKIRLEKNRVTCVHTRKNGGTWPGTEKLCCEHCTKYWDNGCTVKALGCKVYLCNKAERNLTDEAITDWHNLRERVFRLANNLRNAGNYYESKQDWFKGI